MYDVMLNMRSWSPTRQADFSPRCRDNLAGQQPARLADWRLDHNLRTACKGDVPRLCSEALQAKEPQVQRA
jgi:Cysteine rich repeat